MKESLLSNRKRVTNLLAAAILALLVVLMFVPFWHYEGGSASINGYVWLPSDHADVEDYFEETLGEPVDINSVVLAPVLMLVLGVVGVALCAVKSDSSAPMIVVIAFALIGLYGFGSCAILRLGSFWLLFPILCVALLLLAVINMVKIPAADERVGAPARS